MERSEGLLGAGDSDYVDNEDNSSSYDDYDDDCGPLQRHSSRSIRFSDEAASITPPSTSLFLLTNRELRTADVIQPEQSTASQRSSSSRQRKVFSMFFI